MVCGGWCGGRWVLGPQLTSQGCTGVPSSVRRSMPKVSELSIIHGESQRQLSHAMAGCWWWAWASGVTWTQTQTQTWCALGRTEVRTISELGQGTHLRSGSPASPTPAGGGPPWISNSSPRPSETDSKALRCGFLDSSADHPELACRGVNTHARQVELECCAVLCCRFVAWHGMAWRGVAWRGVAWRGVAWRGVAWRGVAWRCVPLYNPRHDLDPRTSGPVALPSLPSPPPPPPAPLPFLEKAVDIRCHLEWRWFSQT